jgi:hypothetical protein
MSAASLSSASWRQVGLITAGAAILLVGLRFLPSGPRLTHMDFILGGPGALEFCDPLNPRFLPVVARSSPVTMAVDSANPLTAGGTEEMTLTLNTVTSKPIGPDDLLATAAQKINLLAVDPSLEDFQAFPPQPGSRPGEWRFAFTPRRTGLYRIFADFTPAATGQEMYASAEVLVTGMEPMGVERMDSYEAPQRGALDRPASRSSALGSMRSTSENSWVAEREGCRFTLQPPAAPIRAREPFELKFTAERLDGGPVTLQPLDGALVSLVAFDQNRTGFVNLHASATDGAAAAGPSPSLVFTVTIPDPGRYVIWSRLSLDGREITAPFRFEVMP